MKGKIENFQYYALVAVIFFIIGIFFNFHFFAPKINHVKYEISVVEQKNKKTVKIDSIAMLKLENMIAQVEKKNDGRFEVLTWSSAFIITIIALLLTINFFVSASKVKELVDDEIEKRTSDIVEKAKKMLAEIELMKSEIEERADESEQLLLIINKIKSEIQNE